MESKYISLALIALLANLTNCSNCGAQGQATQRNYSSYGRVASQQETKHERLKTMPRDLKVPLPPTAKFMGGYRSQYNQSKEITEIRFESSYDYLKLSTWYQKTLSGTGWTVKAENSPQAASLTAFKQGISCTMNFRASASVKSASAPPSSITMLNYSATR